MKILFTGFEPFGGDHANPSFDCLRTLPRAIDGAEIVKMELPVSFRRAPELLLDCVAREEPDAVVCLGLAAGRKKITPEKVGINFAHAGIPDNDGARPLDTPLNPVGPAAYFSTLPVLPLVEALNRAGFPAELSCTAGTYVCNSVLYHLLAWASPRGIPAGFIHVPPVTELPLGTMTEAMAQVAAFLNHRTSGV